MDAVAAVRALAPTQDAVGNVGAIAARLAIPPIADGVPVEEFRAQQVAVVRPVIARPVPARAVVTRPGGVAVGDGEVARQHTEAPGAPYGFLEPMVHLLPVLLDKSRLLRLVAVAQPESRA